MFAVRRARVLAVALVAVLPSVGPAEAGILGKLAGKGAGSRAAGKTPRVTRQDALRRDLARDRATPAKPLLRDRSALRYTTKQSARQEMRRGIPPRRHMAPAHPGRPLAEPDAAARKYGLPRRPEVREDIRLPRGFPVRSNKAVNGRPGVGEWTSPRRVPPSAIKKVTPLAPDRRRLDGR